VRKARSVGEVVEDLGLLGAVVAVGGEGGVEEGAVLHVERHGLPEAGVSGVMTSSDA
jgi:hypothetical protein